MKFMFLVKIYNIDNIVLDFLIIGINTFCELLDWIDANKYHFTVRGF